MRLTVRIVCTVLVLSGLIVPLLRGAQASARPAFVNLAAGQSQVRHAAQSAGFMYVADAVAQTIWIYKAEVNAQPIGSITAAVDGPLGMAVRGNTLYVADNSSNSIVEYANRSNVPTATLTGTPNPIGVAVAGDGTVYACSIAGNVCSAYAPGSLTPTLTLPLACPFAPALDEQNNLYVVYNGICNGRSGIEKFAAGSTKGVDLGITFSGASGGIQVDRDGNILVGDVRKGRIEIYAPGKKRASRAIVTGYPYMFSLNRSNDTLFVAGGALFPAVVAVFDYRSGTALGTVTSGLTSSSGVALQPAP